MMSLFTGLIISVMQASLDGTKCKDIADKEVRIKKKKFILSVAKKETDLAFRSNLKKKTTMIVSFSVLSEF